MSTDKYEIKTKEGNYMKSFSKTDIGVKRSMNQDSVFCCDEAVGSFQNLFIVADGMGGHKAGDYASRLCIESMVAQIQRSDSKTPITIFQEAITYANRAVYEASREDIEYEGMGTTMVACTLQGDTLYVANIGDSRLYLLRDELEQITTDHSLVEEMVKNGNITESEARIHPQKNIITRALGIDDDVQADYFELQVHPSDVILLCSDGLTNMLEDDVIELIIKERNHPEKKTLEEIGESLIEAANLNGGVDNITAVLVEI
jgi:protein phosphatase